MYHGGFAVDAVKAMVSRFEDNESFNAGPGSGLTKQDEAKLYATVSLAGEVYALVK